MLRTAVFDLDGTLVDTAADMLAGANAVFVAKGHTAPLEFARHSAVAFAGGRAMLQAGSDVLELGWGKREIDADYPVFLKAYAAGLCVDSKVYPGVFDALDRLTAAGWRLAICTNKPEAMAIELTQKLGLRDRFGALVGADTLSVRKPDPEALRETVRRAGGDPANCLLVGDTINDRETSANAGVPSVLVTFGPRGMGVEKYRPNGLLHDYADLLEVLESVLPAT